MFGLLRELWLEDRVHGRFRVPVEKKGLRRHFVALRCHLRHRALETKVLLTMHSERVALCGLHRLESQVIP